MLKGKIFRAMLFALTPEGGLAEHLYYQARELAKLGVQVTVVAPRGFARGRELEGLHVKEIRGPPVGAKSAWVRRARHGLFIVGNQLHLAALVLAARPDFVLLASYIEYLAPIWVLPHWLIAHIMRVQYIANLHDPVRDFQVGPAWWHKLSVLCAYLPLNAVLLHQKPPPEARVPRSVRVVEVPVGVYEVSHPTLDAIELRQRWGVRGKGKVFLSFGYIRDNKNLDLVIGAIARVPGSALVIVGAPASDSNRPLEFYTELARELGVEDRVRFFDEFVPEEHVAAYFTAADYVVLTYAASFVSQSGVLNIAARIHKPVLASCGEGPLKESVMNFRLGVFVEPDSVEAIAVGVQSLLEGRSPRPLWKEYESFASWRTNASRLLEAVRKVR
jgi:glycosyltransferase involved in cell wall biosynthesis